MFKKILTLLMVLCMLVSCVLPALADSGHNDPHSKQPAKVEKPVFSPRAGIYDSAQTVTISCATAGATIHYTVNGANPQKKSTVYTGPITISKSSTIIAYAEKNGMKDSEMAVSAYVIIPKLSAPKFTPAPGAYTAPQTVTLSCDTKGVDIKYTLDGSEPNIRSKTYTRPITVTKTTTIKAYAVRGMVQHSDVVTAVYAIKAQAPTFSLAPGKYGSAQIVEIASSTVGATIRYTLDGSDPNVNSPVYSSPLSIEETATVKAYASKEGLADSDISSAAYEIDPWTLVWQDEFDGTSVDTSKWYLENKGDGFGNNEEQYYSPDNAVVNNGELRIQAKKVDPSTATNNKGYTSAKLMTVGKADWKYGKFEARIKLPLGQGFWPAFWMMPANDTYGGWAASGEVDIMEARGRIPDTVSGTLHYGGSWPSNKYTGHEYKFTNGQDISTYHTYSVEWEPGEIRWYVDGVLYQTQNNWNTYGTSGEEKYAFPAPFDQDFYLILNLAIGGNFDGRVVPDTGMFPAEMDVDYVRVYELTGRPYKTVVEPSTDAQPLPENARPADSTGNLAWDANYEQGIKENKEGVDADFGNYWNFVHNASFLAEATASVVDVGGTNFAKIDVTNAGIQPYAVQLEQLVTLGRGRWYTFSFDAKADSPRTLTADLGGGPTVGWAKYSNSYTVNLTSDVQHFSYTFQMGQPSDLLTRIEFNCAATTGPVYIGNVRVVEVPAPVVDYTASRNPLPVSGNLIYNGAFDKYTIDRMSYWNVSTAGAVATVSVPEATRELTANITDGGTDTGAITVDQKGLKLINGNEYKLTFNARAAAERIIAVKFASKDGNTVYLPERQITLGTSTRMYEVSFTMEAASDNEGQLIFMLGGDNSNVYIDDVLLTGSSGYIDPSVVLFPLKNGDFSNSTLDPWVTYAVEGGAAGFALAGGEAKISTTNLGVNPWCVMLAQEGMDFSNGVEYLVEFDARSSVERDIQVILENSAYQRSFDKIVHLTAETQRFSFTFKMTKDDILNLKFLLGNVNGAAPSDISIDNAVCEVKGAKQHNNLLNNGTFKNGTDSWFTYVTDWAGAPANATFGVVGGELQASIVSEGTDFWHVQVIQDITKTALSKDKSYVLTFDASSSVDRKIRAIVENKTNYTKYLDQEISLTGEKKTFSVKFAGVDDAAAHLVFALGLVGNAAGQAHTVSISNVSLIENPYGFTPPPAPEGHDLLNGTFDTDTAGWNLYKADGSTAAISSSDGKLKVDFGGHDGNNTWSTQIYQTDIRLGAGKTYTLSFKASVSPDTTGAEGVSPNTDKKDLLVEVGENVAAPTFKFLNTQTAPLTGNEAAFSYEFTVAGGDQLGKLVFMLGSNTNVGNQYVLLDDVTLAEKSDDGGTPDGQVPGVDIVTDGSFNEGQGNWDSWWGDQWSGVSTGNVSVENNKLLKIHVDTIGGASYSPQVYRPDLSLVSGETYTVSFYAKASAARKMNLNIGKPLDADPWFINYVPTKVIDLSTDMQKFTYEFTVTEPDCNTVKLVFEVGNVAGGNASPVDIYIDNASILDSKGNEVISDGTFEDGIGNWQSWWGDQWSGVSTGSVSVVNDGQLKIDIATIGGASYSPQIFRPNLSLKNGSTYTVSFKAKASTARKMNVNIGKPLTADPWFTNYAPTQVVDITSEMKTYSFSFTVSQPDCDTVKMVFEAGNVAGGNASPVIIYLDDVTITPQ